MNKSLRKNDGTLIEGVEVAKNVTHCSDTLCKPLIFIVFCIILRPREFIVEPLFSIGPSKTGKWKYDLKKKHGKQLLNISQHCKQLLIECKQGLS